MTKRAVPKEQSGSSMFSSLNPGFFRPNMFSQSVPAIEHEKSAKKFFFQENGTFLMDSPQNENNNASYEGTFLGGGGGKRILGSKGIQKDPEDSKESEDPGFAFSP